MEVGTFNMVMGIRSFSSSNIGGITMIKTPRIQFVYFPPWACKSCKQKASSCGIWFPDNVLEIVLPFSSA